MKTISISDLRANLMETISLVKKGKSILVTSRGKPVAQLVPPADKKEEAKAIIKALRKTAKIGDIVSSTREIWKSN
jgi:prevent-host-death family protein